MPVWGIALSSVEFLFNAAAFTLSFSSAGGFQINHHKIISMVFDRVVVRYQIRVRVQVPEQVPGYGYNEMGMSTSTGAKPC